MTLREEFKYTRLGLFLAVCLLVVLSVLFSITNAAPKYANDDLCSQIQTAGNCEEFK